MKKLLAITFLFAAGSLAAVAQQPSSTQPHVPPRHKVRKSRPSAAPALATPVPDPSPVVSYQNGLLTITAENAKLRDVLDRIHDSTGAVIDAPALNERVTVNLGPQVPTQVIAALLAGAHVNYVIMGDTADSRAVRGILVMPETAAGAEPAPPPPLVDADADAAAAMAAAKTKALVVAQTGGDEGVWDNVDVGTPAVPTTPASTPAAVTTPPASTPTVPAPPASAPAESRPAPGAPASAPIVPPGQH